MTNHVPVAEAALSCRCPACGKGKLYSGLLTVVERCSACGMELAAHEKGDGPAFFAIVIVGFVVAGLASWVELAYEPPFWVHAVLWGPLILGLSLFILRVAKAWLIAMQYRHQRDDFK